MTLISTKYVEGLFRMYEMTFGALANIHEKCNIQDSEQVKHVKNKQQLHHNINNDLSHVTIYQHLEDLSYFKEKFQICCILSNFICHIMHKPLLHSRKAQKQQTVKYTIYNMDGNHRTCQKQPTKQNTSYMTT